MTPIAPDVIARLKGAAGEGGWSQDADRLAPKLIEWRGRWTGETPLLLMPESVERVAALVKLCAETSTPITPQGGNTGLVGGQIPHGEVLISTERMNRVREVAPLDDVIVAEAGVTLHDLRAAAADGAGRLFPLSLASEGSCTVGGLLSTNAGGTGVLRYGTTRELTLGVEAVLPNGEIVHGLKRLRKDNTGYDLRGLMIGAEGTLGIVTAAAFKLFPRPASRAVAFVGLESVDKALILLARAKARTGGAVEAFELISRSGLELAVQVLPGARAPLAGAHPWALLIEITSPQARGALPMLEALLEDALEDGLIVDAVVAQDETQARAFWMLREGQSAAQKGQGAAWKHDVSVPVASVPDVPRPSDGGGGAVRAGRARDRLRPRGRRQHPLRRHPADHRDRRCARHPAGRRRPHRPRHCGCPRRLDLGGAWARHDEVCGGAPLQGPGGRGGHAGDPGRARSPADHEPPGPLLRAPFQRPTSGAKARQKKARVTTTAKARTVQRTTVSGKRLASLAPIQPPTIPPNRRARVSRQRQAPAMRKITTAVAFAVATIATRLGVRVLKSPPSMTSQAAIIMIPAAPPK